MEHQIAQLELCNQVRITKISIPLQSSEASCAFRSLLWGPSGECEILGVPPKLIDANSTIEKLQIQIRERSDYFGRFLSAMLGFSNTFGGRIFIGIERRPDFPEKVVLPEVPDFLNKNGLKEYKTLNPENTDDFTQSIFSFDQALLGDDGSCSCKSKRKHATMRSDKILSIVDCFNPDHLTAFWFNARCSQKFKMSIQRMLNGGWITFNIIRLSGKKELYYFKVEPFENGEVSHRLFQNGNLMFRIGQNTVKRGNLVGINWAIFQSQRQFSKACTSRKDNSDTFGPIWPMDKSDPIFVYEDYCYPSYPPVRPSWYDRLDHRAFIIEFFQTLSVERRSELSQTLTEMIWKQFGGNEGAQLYRDALHRLENAEASGRLINADYQRDHIVHSCYVFFLGAFFWQSCRIIHTRLSSYPLAKHIWAIVSTWHDIGYPFQLFLWSLQEELGMFDFHQNSALFPILQAALDQSDPQNSSFWERVEQSLDFPKNSMKNQFDKDIMEKGLMNHGIISALLLERLSIRLQAEGNWGDYQLKSINQAIPVISCHDIELLVLDEEGNKTVKSISLEKHPVAYLLILCDSIQEWDRSAVRRHVLIPNGVDIKILEDEKGNEAIIVKMTMDSKRAKEINDQLLCKISQWSNLKDSQNNDKTDLPPKLTTSIEAYNTMLNRYLMETEKEKVATPLFVKIDFVPMGTQKNPEENVLVLDVGGKLEKGIIDHHQVGAPHGQCTSSLVYEHPDFILDHLAASPIGRIRFIIHKNPDFDSVCSFFLAQRLLTHGGIPKTWKRLVDYALAVDTARLKLDDKIITCSPYIIFCVFSFIKKDNIDILRRGLSLMQYLADWLDANPKGSLEGSDLFYGRHPFEQEQSICTGDFDDYIFDLARARIIKISLPKLYVKGRRIIDGIIITQPRSRMFKTWARIDTERSSQQQGFVFTIVHYNTDTVSKNRSIIAVDPSLPTDEILSLAGLGEALIKLEDNKRKERGIKPIRKEGRRPGYPNHDPWFDGRGSSFNFTIVDSPGYGSVLTVKEIEDIATQPGKWIREDAEAYRNELEKKYGKPEEK